MQGGKRGTGKRTRIARGKGQNGQDAGVRGQDRTECRGVTGERMQIKRGKMGWNVGRTFGDGMQFEEQLKCRVNGWDKMLRDIVG